MKTVKEVSVKLQNKPGSLSQLSDLLGANGITVLALNLRAEGEAGTLNFVATDPTRVINILESAGLQPTLNDVLAVEVPHHPGGLNAILKPLKIANVNVDYLYTCFAQHGVGDVTVVVLGVSDTSKAYESLSKEWIQVFGEELYNF